MGVSAHQCAMRLLVRGLLSDHLLPPSTGPQRSQVRQPQPLTRLACPLGVSILRQQLPAVKRGVVLGLKALDVRLHHRPRCQPNLPSMNYNRIRFANRTAGEVRRLVQVCQRRVVRQLRPKCLDHLIAMQPMTTCQRKDLHQLRSTTMLPSLLRHKATISHDLKTAQQPNLKTLHQRDDLRSQRRRAQERQINVPDHAVHLATGGAPSSHELPGEPAPLPRGHSTAVPTGVQSARTGRIAPLLRSQREDRLSSRPVSPPLPTRSTTLTTLPLSRKGQDGDCRRQPARRSGARPPPDRASLGCAGQRGPRPLLWRRSATSLPDSNRRSPA